MQALQEESGEIKFIQMQFSPDDHYFLARHSTDHVAYDLVGRRVTLLPGSISDHVADGFMFLGPDRIVVIDSREPERSQILRFPSGEVLKQLRPARSLTLRAATQGDYLLVGPLKDHPLGLLDLTTGQLPISFKRNAADIYGGVLVNERLDAIWSRSRCGAGMSFLILSPSTVCRTTANGCWFSSQTAYLLDATVPN